MKINRIYANMSWIVGCKITQSGFALLIGALTARYFGPSNFGLINYAASLVAFASPLVSLGSNDILVNEIVKNPDEEGVILGTSIVMSFCVSLLCIVGLTTFVWTANTKDAVTVWVVLLYSLLLTAQSVEQIQYWFHAKYLSKYVSLVSLFTYIAMSVYKIILLIQKKQIYWFAASHALECFIVGICLLAIYRLKDRQRLTFSVKYVKILWNQGKPYIIAGLLGTLLTQSDRIMLRQMCGDMEVGFYSAAISVVGLTSFVFSAIITSFRPDVLEAKQISQLQFESRIVKLYGIVTYLALLQSVFFTLFARQIINVLYGQEYFRAISMLQIVSWYAMASYLGGARTVWILAENKQRYLWILSLTGMLLNIALNFVLIPRFQGIGAAIATTIAQTYTNFIVVCFVKPLRPNIKYILKGLNIYNIIGQRRCR